MAENPSNLEHGLRHVPTQARSRERLARVLDAADSLLAKQGPSAFTTTRIAREAGIPVGSVYRYFPDKNAIVVALATRYWSDFEDLVAGAAEADQIEPFPDPAAVVLDILTAGFRSRAGFLALWYGGLRTEQVRDATRPTRSAIARSVERIFTSRWPDASKEARVKAATTVVLAGDALLREAFRLDPNGDEMVLEECKVMLGAYVRARLGDP